MSKCWYRGVAKMLIEAKADPNAASLSGHTALIKAAAEGHE